MAAASAPSPSIAWERQAIHPKAESTNGGDAKELSFKVVRWCAVERGSEQKPTMKIYRRPKQAVKAAEDLAMPDTVSTEAVSRKNELDAMDVDTHESAREADWGIGATPGHLVVEATGTASETKQEMAYDATEKVKAQDALMHEEGEEEEEEEEEATLPIAQAVPDVQPVVEHPDPATEQEHAGAEVADIKLDQVSDPVAAATEVAAGMAASTHAAPAPRQTSTSESQIKGEAVAGSDHIVPEEYKDVKKVEAGSEGMDTATGAPESVPGQYHM